jgi:tetratricopeptide (TPR) repeat protein
VSDDSPIAQATTENFADRTKTGVARSETRARLRIAVGDGERYEVQGEHARGGLGRVLKAIDHRLGRPVAIKELLTATAGSERRFEREARITARLEHPAIVPVHDIGEWRTGKPFYAMKMVSGRTLKRAIVDCHGLAERLALVPHVLAVADAIAYAHSEGIIHRDLKPSNVIIGAYGETVVIDWGLAKDMAAPSDSSLDPDDNEPAEVDGDLTKAGTVLGTPSYMAPEQANGEPTDERCDVYAVGAILYTLLSGHAPYESSDSHKVLDAVRAGAPETIAELQPNVPSELAAIVDKAMAREVDDRYRTAAEMVRDLRSFQAGQLVAAHRYSFVELSRRWIARRLLPLAVVTIVALAGLSVVVLVRGGAGTETLCDGFDDKLAGVWDQSRRNDIAAAFARSDKPDAGDIAAQVTTRLDAYSDALVVMYSDTCAATNTRGEQSAELLDLRMACLDRRTSELTAQVELFATQGHDPAVLYKAVEASSALTSLAACEDTDALAAVTPLPDDPNAREEVERLYARLAEAKANQDLGRYAEGLPLADEVLASDASESFAPLRAEALHQQATLRGLLVDLEQAEVSMRMALSTAAEARDDRIVSEAWLGLLWLANERAEYDRTLEMETAASAAVARAGAATRHRGRLNRYLSIALYRTRSLERSLELANAAVAMFESDPAHGPGHPQTATSLRIRGNVLKRQGKYEEAIADYLRAISILESRYGKQHPEVGSPLASLANTYAFMRRLDEAEQAARRAVAIAEAAFGPDSGAVQLPLGVLGQVLYSKQDLDAARPVFERALALAEKARGPDHPEVSRVLDSLGRIVGHQGEIDAARAMFERSAKILEATLGADHPELAHTLTSLAEAHMAKGDWDGAAEVLTRAVAIFDAADNDPTLGAWTRFILANAVDGQGKRREAIALARSAAEVLEQAGARAEHQLAAVNDWLKQSR